MSKYYIMGFTQNEVAQGLVIKQLNDFNEIMANNFKDAESRVRQGIRMEKIQLICYSINTIWIIDGKYNDDKYRKYLELVFVNENLKYALEQQGIYYNYIESIEEKDLPSKIADIKCTIFYINKRASGSLSVRGIYFLCFLKNAMSWPVTGYVSLCC